MIPSNHFHLFAQRPGCPSGATNLWSWWSRCGLTGQKGFTHRLLGFHLYGLPSRWHLIYPLLGLHLYGLPFKYEPQQRCLRDPDSCLSGKTSVGAPPETPSIDRLFLLTFQKQKRFRQNWLLSQACPRFILFQGILITGITV